MDPHGRSTVSASIITRLEDVDIKELMKNMNEEFNNILWMIANHK